MSALVLPKRGFFTFPWDLLAEPVEATLKVMQETYLSDAIVVAGSYHQDRLFAPRGEQGYYMERPTSTVAFHPNLSFYPPEGPWPIVDLATADPAIIAQARDAADKLDMQFAVWLVTLHASTLGQAHPDLCVQNLAGDRYSFNLCPSQPRVRSYGLGLVRDVCRQIRPQSLILESPSYMSASHETHHTSVMTPIGEAAQWLLSLCFCSSCLARAQARDIDAVGALYDARSLLPALLHDDADSLPTAHGPSPLTAILLGWPRLRAYSEMRMDVVMSLVSEMTQVAHGASSRVQVIINTEIGHVSRAWMLGLDVGKLGQAVDGVVVLGNPSDTVSVQREISTLRALAPELPMSVALNSGYPATLERDALVNTAITASEAAAEAIFYRNWGLLTPQRLDWVRAANAALLGLA